MSVLKRALNGAAWSSIGGVIQTFVSLATFSFVAARLGPSEIGAFGVVALAVGFAEILTATSLTESLQQREQLERRHIDATFWITLSLAAGAAMLLAHLAGPISSLFDSPLAKPLFAWAVFAIPAGAVTGVLYALLARDLRFDAVARASASTSIVAGVITIAALIAGAGVWSLIISDLCSRAFKMTWFWKLSRYVPGPPRDLKAFFDLTKFNRNTLLTYLLGYADNAIPRLLTGLLLGAAPLGYLIIAQRVLSLISQLVLAPLSSVTMAAVARLQSDMKALQELIITLYTIAAIIGYPAFIGAVLITPDLAALLGDKWVAAILPTQILLFIGLRTTTGMFNIAILRGVGQSAQPLILLGLGAILNLALVLPLSAFGVAGIATAILIRTYATWPLGLWMVKRATGLGVITQARAGATAFAAALMMAVAVAVTIRTMPDAEAALRLCAAVMVGVGTYAGLLLISIRSEALEAAQLLWRGQTIAALKHVARRFAPGAMQT